MVNGENIDPNLLKEMALLYDPDSKHGSYLPPPFGIERFLPNLRLDEQWRSPKPRLKILFEQLPPMKPTRVVELGANTGYQTLELALQMPQTEFVAIEGNRQHAQLIENCAKILDLNNVSVISDYQTPDNLAKIFPNSLLLDFNVAHHAGVDFQYFKVNDVQTWWSQGLPNWLGQTAGFQSHFFQSGFRWGGNPNEQLHDSNDPSGFVEKVISALVQQGDYSEWVLKFWLFEPGEKGVTFSEISSSELTTRLISVSNEFGYKGEYFKRPLIQISTN